jgi:hypothetical protein
MAHIVYARDDAGAQLELIEFDATIYDNYVDTATVTEHPIEDGQSISDYVKPQLSRLTLTGTITNTPLTSTSTSRGSPAYEPLVAVPGRTSFQARQRAMREGAAAVGGLGTPVQPPGFKVPPSPIRIIPASYSETAQNFSAEVVTFPSYVSRTRAIYQRLVWLQENAKNLTVGTSLKDYFDMLITSVSVPRSEAEDSIDITIEFVKYIQVTATAVTVRRPKPKVKPEIDRVASVEPSRPTAGRALPETPTVGNPFARSEVQALTEGVGGVLR